MSAYYSQFRTIIITYSLYLQCAVSVIGLVAVDSAHK
jgi:hypothetical protein